MSQPLIQHPIERTPPTSTPSDMGITVLTARKRKTQPQDENAGASRRPVKASSEPAPTTIAFNLSRSSILNRRTSESFSRKPSIVFPGSSKPAPPVVTTTYAGIDATERHSSSDNEPPRLGKRLRPSIVAKEKENRKIAEAQAKIMGPSLWSSLLTRNKGVISQTLDRTLLQGEGSPFSATMITPGLLRDGLKTNDVGFLSWKGAKRAIDERPDGRWKLDEILQAAMDHCLVALGIELMEAVPGLHFTFIDPRCHNDANAMVRRALRLMKLFTAEGCRRNRIVFTIPATEAGVQAARNLEEKHRVRTNLTFVSGLTHAAVCAEAAASFVTFPYASMREAFVHRTTRNPLVARALEVLNPTSQRLADDAIEATTGYCETRGLKTRVLVSLTGMPDLCEGQRLNGFDGIVLDGDQSQKAKLAMPLMLSETFRAPKENSQAKARAREAQHLSHLASVDGAFLAAMSAETRGVTQATLERGVKDDELRMQKATGHMLQFLQGEAQLAHLDNGALEELYRGDVLEHERVTRLMEANITPKQLVPIRFGDVGYRMASSSWDKPDKV